MVEGGEGRGEVEVGREEEEESRFHCCLPGRSLSSRHIPERPQFVPNDSLEDFVACDGWRRREGHCTAVPD